MFPDTKAWAWNAARSHIRQEGALICSFGTHSRGLTRPPAVSGFLGLQGTIPKKPERPAPSKTPAFQSKQLSRGCAGLGVWAGWPAHSGNIPPTLAPWEKGITGASAESPLSAAPDTRSLPTPSFSRTSLSPSPCRCGSETSLISVKHPEGELAEAVLGLEGPLSAWPQPRDSWDRPARLGGDSYAPRASACSQEASNSRSPAGTWGLQHRSASPSPKTGANKSTKHSFSNHVWLL